MSLDQSLSVNQVYQVCDLTQFDFDTTAELDSLSKPVGQDRALEAIEFGVDIQQQGFNVFALGDPGVGKHKLVDTILASRSADGSPQYDWCYVNNFDDPQKPLLLKLESGLGAKLSKDMLQLVEDLLTSLPSSFQNEDYRNRRREIEEEMNERYEKAFNKLETDARERHVALIRTPAGYTLAPLVDGNVIPQEEYAKLASKEQKRIEKVIAELQLELQSVVGQLPMLKREASHRIQELNQEITRLTVEQFIGWLESQYLDHPQVTGYLAAVKDFAIENAEYFLPQDGNPEIEHVKQKARAFTAYRVNVIVDNTGASGAPLVFEDNPTYQNLVGSVEYVSETGNLVTNFTLIKAGALHRANGGYLLLDARKLLNHIYAWEGLKRALKSGEVKIASLQEMLSLGSMRSLQPESIPIDIKVILLGEPLLYYLLNQYDPEFAELFNVAADFSGNTDRNADNQMLYARMLATMQQQDDMQPLHKASVGRIIEHASRLAEDSAKLSLNLEGLRQLMQEADYWARKHNSDVTRVDDVERAIASQQRRHDRIREQLQEQITRDIKMIDTDGSKTAQVNGLSVIQLGDHAFGTIARITATARLGVGKVIDIERESKLGGDIHSKGVLIISAYLADKYARECPLPLAASLVFEQSYGGVEGDSASCAEVCVLLSAIGGIPLRQNLAVTGSMNQLGEVQAIGGVNYKIEGFFDICKSRGLSGNQGVIIPAANQVHLMLNTNIRDAVSAGKFHIYTVKHIEEVMTPLSGLAAGEMDKEGVYSAGSVNRIVRDRIDKFQQLRRHFAEHENTDKETGD
ncbi:MAG: Lon protease family protein, partial [Planctomycetota bacterium]